MSLSANRLWLSKVLKLAPQFSNEWSMQGLGMLRLYLSKSMRLHIWDCERATENVSVIHNHPWDFTSEILAGRILDQTYWAFDDGIPTHHRRRILCGPGGGCTEELVQAVRLVPRPLSGYGAGEVYSRSSDMLHESRPTRGCVTLVTRRFKEDVDHADVCYPLNTEWVAAEPRTATEEEVRSMCSLALQALGEVE